MMLFAFRRLLVLGICIVLSITSAVCAQNTRTWTGFASPDNNWSTIGNWDTAVPVSGDAAVFDGAGNGNTNISLGGAIRPINALFFDTASAAAYTIGQMPGDTLDFDSGGSVTVTDTVTNPQTINATINTNGVGLLASNSVSNGVATGNGLIGLTFGPVVISSGAPFAVSNNVANATTLLNGTIADASGQSGSVILSAGVSGSANNNNFIINGNNTYSGGTTIQANTGNNGAIYVGSDSAFGTGKITTQSSANNPEIRALGGTHIISNAIDLNQGLNFAGTNNVTLDGAIAIASGNSRTFSSKITGGGALYLGATPGSSTIYLGNPVSNGGDGTGRTIIVSASTVTGMTGVAGTVVVNALFQDVNSSDPNSAVQYGGNKPGTVVINALQTYTSPTKLGGGSSTIEFHDDYNVGDPSGPFGLGTLIANSGANSQIAPTGGDRTIANPFRLDFGFTVINIPSDNSGVNFSGPITFTSSDNRLIQNLMPSTGGTLTLGSAGTPSTFTMEASVADKTLTFTGSGRTIINDTIYDGNANITHIAVTNSNTTTFNGDQNTDGNFTVSGSNSTVIINGARSGLGTMTVSGTNAQLLVNGSKNGTGAVTVTAGTLGGTGSIDGSVTNSGTIAPGMNGVGSLTLTGDLTMAANSHLAIELSGTSSDQILVGGSMDLSAAEFLDVTGTGTGPWVIATYTGSLTGSFDNVTAGYLVDYGTRTNSQITLSAGIAGDWNHDGKVDAADYVVWRKDPNNNGGSPGGYDMWRTNFGNGSSGSGSSLSGASAVPEPATMLLVFVSMAGFTVAGTRRRVAA